ncbi:diguanylate cyclase [Catenovulum sp. 2E275]|uniref:GGDEF domain-containing response regulator n=1 Tax=Catenovulum sp. 2E275 TaxID=2980497 RepID=UPI0021D2E34F|nr:diguanylate cyclase [Catenovulum sp. 2E275]MCU4677190.1 diguanylate cyclase [Catenovulum sp. 2E275]
MKNLVLIVNSNPQTANRVAALVDKLGFSYQVIDCYFKLEKNLSLHEEYFCACTDINIKNAPNGEAIDLLTSHDIPTFVLTELLDESIRETVLAKTVIDYITTETIHSFDYVAKLLLRLKTNLSVRILIVDDASATRKYLKNLLVRHNFNVVEATSGEGALEKLNQYTDIKLVLTDQTMPKMSGIELVQAIRKKYSQEHLAIIAISATPKSIISARFLKNGANDCLAKPFNAEEFYARVFRNLEYIEYVAQVQFAARHDYLTKVYNRRTFFELAQNDIEESKNQIQACIAIIDLDYFKKINDQFGHDAGDIVLVETAKRITSHFRDAIVARLGGEEFCIFLPDISLDEAYFRFEFLCHHFESFEFTIPNKKIQVTASIGVSSCNAKTLEQAMKQADLALYEAKSRGRNGVVSFDEMVKEVN